MTSFLFHYSNKICILYKWFIYTCSWFSWTSTNSNIKPVVLHVQNETHYVLVIYYSTENWLDDIWTPNKKVDQNVSRQITILTTNRGWTSTKCDNIALSEFKRTYRRTKWPKSLYMHYYSIYVRALWFNIFISSICEFLIHYL
jgi:hypothetical protein